MVTFTGPEKAGCMFKFHDTHSAMSVQQWFTTTHGKPAPPRKSIYMWHKSFVKTGCLCEKKCTGRWPNLETVDRVQEVFQCSPQKSIRRVSREMGGVSNSTVWRVLCKRLACRWQKFQLLQKLQPGDRQLWLNFCVDMLNRLEEDNSPLDTIVFSDEATFHVSGKVNCHNVLTWGSENQRQILEHQRDSMKCNVFCAVGRRQVYGPFFFMESSITGSVYLNMLTEFLILQLDVDNVIFHQTELHPTTTGISQVFSMKLSHRDGLDMVDTLHNHPDLQT
jgi:hypothetical protein